MGEELVEEVHEEVDLETADTQHHVFLRLRPVAAVVPPGLLPLHPQKGQLLKLYSGGHRSHLTDGNWIKLTGIQRGARWFAKHKQCPGCSLQCLILIRESVSEELGKVAIWFRVPDE